MLKKKTILAALSNGNIRFLVDLVRQDAVQRPSAWFADPGAACQAKNADLPWDVVFSVDLFGTCKP